MPIIIHVSQTKLGRRGTLDPTGQLVIFEDHRLEQVGTLSHLQYDFPI